jgi:hypothetical protein
MQQFIKSQNEEETHHLFLNKNEIEKLHAEIPLRKNTKLFLNTTI